MSFSYRASGGLWIAHMLACASAALAAGSAQGAATVTFEADVVPFGQKYGQAFGQSPGDPVLTQARIEMSVQNFYDGPFTGFVRAEVGGRYLPFFESTPLELNAISVAFDFTDLLFTVDTVTFEVREFSPGSNFSVNGATPFELDRLGDIPAIVAQGITATLLPDPQHVERITLASHDGTPIDRFLIGGYELAIDNVAAVPEPATFGLLALAGAAAMRRGRPRRSA